MDPTLKEIFTDPNTGLGWAENSKHRRPRLAATLEALAQVATLIVITWLLDLPWVGFITMLELVSDFGF